MGEWVGVSSVASPTGLRMVLVRARESRVRTGAVPATEWPAGKVGSYLGYDLFVAAFIGSGPWVGGVVAAQDALPVLREDRLCRLAAGGVGPRWKARTSPVVPAPTTRLGTMRMRDGALLDGRSTASPSAPPTR